MVSRFCMSLKISFFCPRCWTMQCWLGRLPCACVRLNWSKSDEYASDSLHVLGHVTVHWMLGLYVRYAKCLPARYRYMRLVAPSANSSRVQFFSQSPHGKQRAVQLRKNGQRFRRPLVAVLCFSAILRFCFFVLVA